MGLRTRPDVRIEVVHRDGEWVWLARRRYVVTAADEGQRLHRLARRWLADVPLSAVFRML